MSRRSTAMPRRSAAPSRYARVIPAQDARLLRSGDELACLHQENIGGGPFENAPATIDDERFGSSATTCFAQRQEARQVVGNLGSSSRSVVGGTSGANENHVDAFGVSFSRGPHQRFDEDDAVRRLGEIRNRAPSDRCRA